MLMVFVEELEKGKVVDLCSWLYDLFFNMMI